LPEFLKGSTSAAAVDVFILSFCRFWGSGVIKESSGLAGVDGAVGCVPQGHDEGVPPQDEFVLAAVSIWMFGI